MAAYTVYGNLAKTKGKEHLNNIDEINDWLTKVYGKYSTVVVVRDESGGERVLDDDGENWKMRPIKAATFKEYYESEDVLDQEPEVVPVKPKKEPEEEPFDLPEFNKKYLPRKAAIRSRDVDEPEDLGDIETPAFIRKNPKREMPSVGDKPFNYDDLGDIETPAYIRKNPEYVDLGDVEIPSHIRKAKTDVVKRIMADRAVPIPPRKPKIE